VRWAITKRTVRGPESQGVVTLSFADTFDPGGVEPAETLAPPPLPPLPPELGEDVGVVTVESTEESVVVGELPFAVVFVFVVVSGLVRVFGL
jgi:hypothetical protein